MPRSWAIYTISDWRQTYSCVCSHKSSTCSTYEVVSCLYDCHMCRQNLFTVKPHFVHMRNHFFPEDTCDSTTNIMMLVAAHLSLQQISSWNATTMCYDFRYCSNNYIRLPIWTIWKVRLCSTQPELHERILYSYCMGIALLHSFRAVPIILLLTCPLRGVPRIFLPTAPCWHFCSWH